MSVHKKLMRYKAERDEALTQLDEVRQIAEAWMQRTNEAREWARQFYQEKWDAELEAASYRHDITNYLDELATAEERAEKAEDKVEYWYSYKQGYFNELERAEKAEAARDKWIRIARSNLSNASREYWRAEAAETCDLCSDKASYHLCQQHMDGVRFSTNAESA